MLQPVAAELGQSLPVQFIVVAENIILNLIKPKFTDVPQMWPQNLLRIKIQTKSPNSIDF